MEEGLQMLSIKHEKLFRDILSSVNTNSDFKMSRNFIQHGSTSICTHSIMVAYQSCKIAEKSGVRISYKELIRGALLHDYFLYDWHDKEHNHRRPHGFFHPLAALANAERDFELTDIEKDIIKKHMFPLTPVPPRYKESWIVCLADKMCSAKETIIR